MHTKSRNTKGVFPTAPVKPFTGFVVKRRVERAGACEAIVRKALNMVVGLRETEAHRRHNLCSHVDVRVVSEKRAIVACRHVGPGNSGCRDVPAGKRLERGKRP